jgi:hypothetical protein
VGTVEEAELNDKRMQWHQAFGACRLALLQFLDRDTPFFRIKGPQVYVVDSIPLDDVADLDLADLADPKAMQNQNDVAPIEMGLDEIITGLPDPCLGFASDE